MRTSHNYLLISIASIALAVSCLLIISIVRYNSFTGRKNDVIVISDKGNSASKKNDVRLKNFYVSSQSSQSKDYTDSNSDPILDGLIGEPDNAHPDRDVTNLYHKLRLEKRDEIWAAASERALQSQFRDVPYLTKPPRIICGSTLCEIAGAIMADTSVSNANIAMMKIQSPEIIESSDLGSLDPELQSVMFGTSKRNPFENTFVRYVFRKNSGY